MLGDGAEPRPAAASAPLDATVRRGGSNTRNFAAAENPYSVLYVQLYRCLYTFNAPFSFVGFVAAVAQIYVIPPGRGARRGLITFPFALQRS